MRAMLTPGRERLESLQQRRAALGIARHEHDAGALLRKRAHRDLA